MNKKLKGPRSAGTKSSRRKFLLGLVIVFLCIFALFFVKGCKKKTLPTEEITGAKRGEAAKPAKVVLHSSLAGTWYPADAETLTKQLQGFFQKADVKPKDNVIALILPHAGYRYSGQTAACGLKATNKKYKRVVVIGPAHHVLMQEVLSVPRVTHYETPLGQIPLDVEFIDKLLKFSMFQNVPHAFKYENSIEMELPLLQYRLQTFKLVPIAAGYCSPQTIAKTGKILKSLIDSETLVVASSDFTHYGRYFHYVPFTEGSRKAGSQNIPEQIKNLDMGGYEHIKNLDYKGFLQYCRKTGATICGRVPIAILLSMLDKTTGAELIKYTTSGELEGNFTRSISYLSIAFSGTWQNCPSIEPQPTNPELTEEDKKQLLALARKSIVYALQKRRAGTPLCGSPPQVSDLGVTISDATGPRLAGTLKHPRAAFVTLEENSRLRGCMGDIFPRQPLYKSVIINAINASVNDSRFFPVMAAECNDITIEISVLTVPRPVASPDEIRIGIDGVVLNKDGHSAVYLPQVAPQYGWDVNQTLTNLSLKAKLPADAWKEGANFLVFQAIVFGEER